MPNARNPNLRPARGARLGRRAYFTGNHSSDTKSSNVMSSFLTKRRVFLGMTLAAGGLALAMVLARVTITGVAIGHFLKSVGATEVTYRVTGVSPWRVVVENVGFLLKAQAFSAKRVSFDRTHWWSASLGHVQVEQAKVPLAVERLAARGGEASAAGGGSAPGPLNLPFEEISVDGQIVVQAAGLPDQALTVKLAAKQKADDRWDAQVQVDGPGLGLAATGTYDQRDNLLDFTVPTVNVDLKTWQAFAERVVPMPATNGWEIEGRLTGRAAGRVAAGKVAAAGNFQLREGQLRHAAKALTAEGVELDLEFTDLTGMRTKPGSLRVRELRTGTLTLRELEAGAALAGPDRIDVSHLKLSALGGTVQTEPFSLAPSRDELTAVLLVDGISIEQVMALTKDLPAKAKGQVNGRFPINLNASGLHLGTGWLTLTSGVNAEIEFNAKGLLTGGVSPNNPSYAVLQKIESGLLKLGISELRLDIQPPDGPAGRSATLHLKGAPLDPEVKAPVILDLNVNGPLEKLLKLGMGSSLGVGAKP